MKISIACITYNHENFIKDALDSFLEQDIDCDIEIIISDDGSKDTTRDILKKYEKQYPNIIKIYLQKINLGPMQNFKFVLSKCTGNYISYCDGDDYWDSKDKLKKQFNALEKNKNCSFSFHDVLLIEENKRPIHHLSKGRKNENFPEGIINGLKIINTPIRIVHANSLLFRKETLEKHLSLFDKVKFSPNGDFALTMILVSEGDAYYFKDLMSTYRIASTSISNSRSISDIKVLNQMLRFYNKLNKYFEYKFSNELHINIIGTKMSYYEGNMTNSLKSHRYFNAFKYLFMMLINHKKSQYTFRDILWLARKQFGK